ncbi:unnamed protein product [Tuber melanosporum]|uniref:(Perigord truffle) hypothetical protein n=1 Tax=Tuber melanosporum (strain Mel28) TaxID=656061 RepID=D5GF86_TUBMM|nr:uncharacterized protein GSTUM_00006774001 [Tuber melanosporum]CAZ83179.1 unnamed protein product [Tuber melanosporum]
MDLLSIASHNTSDPPHNKRSKRHQNDPTPFQRIRIRYRTVRISISTRVFVYSSPITLAPYPSYDTGTLQRSLSHTFPQFIYCINNPHPEQQPDHGRSAPYDTVRCERRRDPQLPHATCGTTYYHSKSAFLVPQKAGQHERKRTVINTNPGRIDLYPDLEPKTVKGLFGLLVPTDP